MSNDTEDIASMNPAESLSADSDIKDVKTEAGERSEAQVATAQPEIVEVKPKTSSSNPITKFFTFPFRPKGGDEKIRAGSHKKDDNKIKSGGKSGDKKPSSTNSRDKPKDPKDPKPPRKLN